MMLMLTKIKYLLLQYFDLTSETKILNLQSHIFLPPYDYGSLPDKLVRRNLVREPYEQRSNALLLPSDAG